MMDLAFPIAILLAGSLVVYIVARLTGSKAVTGFAAMLILAASAAVLYSQVSKGDAMASQIPAHAGPIFATFEASPLALFVGIASIGLAFVVALFSIGYMEKHNIGKYYALLLMMTAGMVGVGLAGDLFNLFVMFELMSIASFALVAFEDNWEPVEAGIKYLMLSALGSMVALLGIVLVFTYTGNLSFADLQSGNVGAAIKPELMLGIAALFIAGFGVKAAIVPMHTWLPDAHSAAPSGISAMLSGMVISVGLITMIKALTALKGIELGLLLPALALITMFVGNIMAWKQTDLKRMLAYSSIAHMGYILAGIAVAFAAPAAAGFEGFRGGFFHILNHAIFKGGAFLCAGAILATVGSRDLKEIAGIGRKLPVVGVCFTIFVLALVGAPPLNGFVSKLFICKAALILGPLGFLLTVSVVFNSFLSLFYYIPALNQIIIAPEASDKVNAAPATLSASMTFAIAILAILTLVLGIDPQTGLNIVEPAAHFVTDMLHSSLF